VFNELALESAEKELAQNKCSIDVKFQGLFSLDLIL
jgi:hypothetical protein